MNNSNAEIYNCLSNLFEQAIWELHQLVGMQLLEKIENSHESLKKEGLGDCIVSILTASTESVKVSATIILPYVLIKRLQGDPSAGEHELLDYCGEINNQLVGRFKNKLLSYNVRLMLGIPTTLSGSNISGHTIPDSMSSICHYQHGNDNFSTIFQVVVASDFEMQDQPDKIDDQPADGELAFF